MLNLLTEFSGREYVDNTSSNIRGLESEQLLSLSSIRSSHSLDFGHTEYWPKIESSSSVMSVFWLL